jgi:hypothetical protein
VKDAGDFGVPGISQSVTIDGANLGSVTVPQSDQGGAAIYISGSPALNVTIRNLTINGVGLGQWGVDVDAQNANVTVDNCRIENFSADGIFFGLGLSLIVENSRIESFGSTGIDIYSTGSNVLLRNTVITEGLYGFSVDQASGSVQSSLQNVTIQGATTDAVIVNTGATEITNSVLTQSGVAVLAQSGSTISLANTAITANQTGVCSSTGAKVRLDTNDIYDSTTAAIANCGGQVKTSGTNRTSGATLIPASLVSNSVLF